jgi:hypothetical protein
MSTKRLQVRDALISLIATATGLTPFTNLDFALEEAGLPAVAVVSESDSVDVEASSAVSSAPEVVQATFAVHLLVSRSADPESEADGIETLIRAALAANPSLGGVAQYVRYRGGDWAFDLGDSASRRMVFRAVFIS